MIPVQELKRTINRPAVLLFCDIPLTRSRTLSDVVIQARALLFAVARKIFLTASQLIELADQLDRIFHCRCARIRPEIF